MLEVPLLLTPEPAPGTYGQHLADIMNGYPGPQQRNDLYVLLENHTSTMKKHALDEQKLEELGVMPLIEASLAQRSLQRDSVEFYNFKARYGNGVVIFDPETVSILDYIITDDLASSTTDPTTVAKHGE